MQRIALVFLILISMTSAALAAELPHWLAGHWRSEDQGRITDEVWLAPAQGLMTGMSRTHGGKVPFFEFVRIERRGDALYYIAQPRGGAATEFRATEVAETTIAFENASHDFPQRIVYEHSAPDVLAARIEGRIDGKLRVERWNYRRVRDAASR